MTSSDTLPLSEDQQALQDTHAGSWLSSFRLPRCGPRWRPGPVTALSCTPVWPVSSGSPG